MNRRRALSLLAAGFAAPSTAFAETSAVDSVVRQLRELGYRNVRATRTLLGRVRVVAVNARGRREIVLNPRTGVILRDYFYRDNGEGSGVEILGERGGGQAGGPAADNDDDDDDRDDRDDRNGGGGDGGGSGGGGEDDGDDD